MTGVEVFKLHDISSRRACPVALALFRWENSDDHGAELYGCHGVAHPFLRIHEFDGWRLSLTPYFQMSRSGVLICGRGHGLPAQLQLSRRRAWARRRLTATLRGSPGAAQRRRVSAAASPGPAELAVHRPAALPAGRFAPIAACFGARAHAFAADFARRVAADREFIAVRRFRRDLVFAGARDDLAEIRFACELATIGIDGSSA